MMHDEDLEAEQRVPLFVADDDSPLDRHHETKQQQEQTAASSLEAQPQQQQVIRSRSAVSSASSSNQHHHSQQIGSHKKRRRRKRKHSGVLEQQTNLHHSSAAPPSPGFLGRLCNKFCPKLKCHDRYVRSTLWIMNIVAKLLLWSTMIALTVAIVWYSYELKNNGTDHHLIAWFSAGAFVILGFPVSMWGIISHLANYNQPNVQCYIVRILWMVPIYSIESWLCLRFHELAIYIETLRDCYESYVLYSFFQFLIQVLGGEEALILMLKDKSPTRGTHIWGMQWCIKPWLMGQPVRKTLSSRPEQQHYDDPNHPNHRPTTLKRVYWKSPFFVKCKFGVLQYVLCKFVCSIVVMILEHFHVYKEGDFTPKGGYLYICILTNTSQCWALYCLILFYYATKNELSPIRPVGKFLSVKALVFFTWWQSLAISILYQIDLIPHYQSDRGFTTSAFGGDGSSSCDFAPYSGMLTDEQALALDEGGGAAWEAMMMANSNSTAAGGSPTLEWTSEDVAKGLQDYLICIEMFLAAIIHTFVFPSEEYTPQAVQARAQALNQMPNQHWPHKRLGRKWKDWDSKSAFSAGASTNASSDVEMQPLAMTASRSRANSEDEDDYLMHHPMDHVVMTASSDEDDDNNHFDFPSNPRRQLEPVQDDEDELDEFDDGADDASADYDEEDSNSTSGEDQTPSLPAVLPTPQKTNFFRAVLDSTIPQDLRDNTVGIIKGDYVVEKKTLLHHAATSDSYDLFRRVGGTPSSPRSSINARPKLGSLPKK